MTSLSGVKRPWLDEPVVATTPSEPASEGPEDLSTNSERSSLSVSPSPSEAATVPGERSICGSRKMQRLCTLDMQSVHVSIMGPFISALGLFQVRTDILNVLLRL